MKLRFLIAILLAVLTCGQLFALDHGLMLEAIRIKENSTTVGKAGERGPWQMMPKTVQDCGGYDYAAADRHLSRLEYNLRKRQVDPSVFNIALAWNSGFTNAVNGRAPEISYSYARDVVRIYLALSSGRPVRAEKS